MRAAFLLVVVSLLAACASMPPSSLAPLPEVAQRELALPAQVQTPAEEFALLVNWLEGGWNNHQQRLEQRLEGGRETAALEQSITRIASPAPDGVVFRVVSAATADDVNARERIFLFQREAGTDILDMRILIPAQGVQLDPQQLMTLDREGSEQLRGCTVRWQWQDGYFAALSRPELCLVRTATAQVRLSYAMTLQRDQLEIIESAEQLDGTPLSATAPAWTLRRLRSFRGWAMVSAAGPGARASDAQGPWLSANPLQVHDQGQRVVLRDARGQDSDFALELATLRLAEPRAVDMLRLSLVSVSSGQTLAYTWADPDAPRLGINVGWFQAALERLVD